jgi:DNA end-binding protein Ku
MKAINKIDIEIGNSDIPISIYSAVESETHLKQISPCCNSAIEYKRFCSACNKEVNFSEIKKAIDLGSELKQVEADKLKFDNGNLKILGVLNSENEEDGVFKDGTTWFIGIQADKKNKSKTERSLMKFSYLREVLRLSNFSLLGLITSRGKEHIVILKPYFKGLVGLGVYHLDRIREINEISGYSLDFQINKETLDLMAKSLTEKEKVNIKGIENKREKMIQALANIETSDLELLKSAKQNEVNPT